MNHKNLRNFATTKKLNQWQIYWAELLTDFEFQIYYKKNNENDRTDVLSRWFDHEKVKWVHVKILFKENEVLTKKLTTIYKVKNTSLTNNELIQECYNNWIDEHFKVKRTENLIQ